MDDRYQIIQRTAELPFGTQFEATDQLISRQAQIHRFANPGDDAPSDWKKRFEKGSGALTTLSHMGLPIVYDRGVNSAGPYLIRQLVNEPTLVSRLQQGPLSEYELWELAQQVLDIHSMGVSGKFFHGALLLDQICYATRPGGEKRYYMTDFGLAELHHQINGTKDYMGMPCLISLEQAAGEAPSEASEIFSIGQLLYLCMAENHPFASNSVEEMAELHKNYPLAPISSFRDDVPKAMVDWIVRMTAIDTKDRFSTYAEALENLPEPIQAAPIPVIPSPSPHPRCGPFQILHRNPRFCPWIRIKPSDLPLGLPEQVSAD
jgi:serine/threonine protein kinase